MSYRLLPSGLPTVTKQSATPIVVALLVVATAVGLLALKFIPSAATTPAQPPTGATTQPVVAVQSDRPTPNPDAQIALNGARTDLLSASEQLRQAHRLMVVVSADLDRWPWQVDHKRADDAAQSALVALDSVSRALEQIQAASLRKEQ